MLKPLTIPVHLAVVQATPFCNINCKYCYLPDRDTTERMSSAKLSEVFKFLFEEPDLLSPQLKVLWHAGEPLAVPIDFYREALAIQQRLCPPEIRITNSLQTNATLLNGDWCEFLKREQFSVGVSLDGPEHCHDRNRVTRSGKGTFALVCRGIEHLHRAAIPFHVITVLNEYSLGFPRELWDCYRMLGINRIHFLIEELQGVHTFRELKRLRLQIRVEAFLSEIQELRNAHAPNVYIRELDEMWTRLQSPSPNVKEIEQIPLGVLSVSVSGDVSTFSPELVNVSTHSHGMLTFGNTASGRLRDIISHPNFISAYRSILRGYSRCLKSCPYYGVCGGGQPSIKLFENGTFDSTETPSCQMRIKAAANVLLTEANLASLDPALREHARLFGVTT